RHPGAAVRVHRQTAVAAGPHSTLLRAFGGRLERASGARRYDFIPRFEVAITILRFVVLVVGVSTGVSFFWVVVAQAAVQVFLSLGPGLWVMVHDLGHLPRFRGARLADYKALMHISFFMA